jgi:hypothetical protein
VIVVSNFVSHPNTRTLHRGTRENGPECGQPGDSWVGVDATDPLEAVVRYATPPCTKCIDHSLRLSTLYQIEHSATVIRQDRADIIDRLPWELPKEADSQ